MVRRWAAPGRRGTLLVLLGAGLAAVTLTVGVVAQGAMSVAVGAPEPVTPTSTTPTQPSAPPDEAAFWAIAGPACPVTGSRSVQVSPGWQVVAGNSWTGDGCGDRFLYSAPDDPNHVQWRFAFDTPADRSCRITVFVPDSPLASAKVWYGVADRFENASYRVGGFTVDQKAGRGGWVDAGTVSVGTGALLVNVNGEQGPTGVTAGPLRVSCSVTEP